MPVRKNFDLLREHRAAMAEAEKEMLRLGLAITRDAADYLDEVRAVMDGDVKDDIHPEVEQFLQGMAIKLTVGTNIRHARFLHDGTGPRRTRPPIEPIRYWVEKKLKIANPEEIESAAWAIAQSIKQRGTSMSRADGQNKGPAKTPFMDVALEKHQDTFVRRIRDAYMRGFN